MCIHSGQTEREWGCSGDKTRDRMGKWTMEAKREEKWEIKGRERANTNRNRDRQSYMKRHKSQRRERKIIRNKAHLLWTHSLSGPKRRWYVTSKWSLLDSWADDLSAVMLSCPPREPNLALPARRGHLKRGTSYPATNIRKRGRTHEGQWWTAEKEGWIWAVLNMTRPKHYVGQIRS